MDVCRYGPYSGDFRPESSQETAKERVKRERKYAYRLVDSRKSKEVGKGKQDKLDARWTAIRKW